MRISRCLEKNQAEFGYETKIKLEKTSDYKIFRKELKKEREIRNSLCREDDRQK